MDQRGALFVIRKDTKIKVDFESSGQSFEGVVFTFQEDTPEGTITAYYEDDNFNHKAFHSGDKVPMGKMAYFTATPKVTNLTIGPSMERKEVPI